MSKWQIFEDMATDYLSKKILIENISFENAGGSDSTRSDIDVKHNNKVLFVIEAKLSPSLGCRCYEER